MNEDRKHRSSVEYLRDTAAKVADTAVRRALVEGRQHVLRFLIRRLGDADAAEDVLQTFMLRAIDRSEQLRDVRAVRGWLSQILASSIADYGRKVARQRQREVVMAPTDLDNIQDGFDEELDEAICNCLYKLLPTIKPEYAEVIWRVDLQEQPRETVAADLGITLNNLTVRLHPGSTGVEDEVGTDVPDLPRSWLSRLRLRRDGKGTRALSGAERRCRGPNDGLNPDARAFSFRHQRNSPIVDYDLSARTCRSVLQGFCQPMSSLPRHPPGS